MTSGDCENAKEWIGPVWAFLTAAAHTVNGGVNKRGWVYSTASCGSSNSKKLVVDGCAGFRQQPQQDRAFGLPLRRPCGHGQTSHGNRRKVGRVLQEIRHGHGDFVMIRIFFFSAAGKLDREREGEQG